MWSIAKVFIMNHRANKISHRKAVKPATALLRNLHTLFEEAATIYCAMKVQESRVDSTITMREDRTARFCRGVKLLLRVAQMRSEKIDKNPMFTSKISPTTMRQMNDTVSMAGSL